MKLQDVHDFEFRFTIGEKMNGVNMEPKTYFSFRVGIVSKEGDGNKDREQTACAPGIGGDGYTYRSVQVIQESKSFDVAQAKAMGHFDRLGFKNIEVKDVTFESSTEARKDEYGHLIVG